MSNFAFDDIQASLEAIEREMLELGAYMPALATILRIHADEMADKYPDDTNGGQEPTT